MVKYSERLDTPKKASIAIAAIKLKTPGSNKLPSGAVLQLSREFGTSKRNIQRCCQLYRIHEDGSPESADCRRKTMNSGRKTKLTDSIKQQIYDIVAKYVEDYVHCTVWP